jgi:hypothetical protein
MAAANAAARNRPFLIVEIAGARLPAVDALIDRHGRLAANIEGNQYSTDQLTDLTRSVLDLRPAQR